MNQLFADLAKGTQKQFKEQGEKYAMEIAAMKRANLDTQHILTTKTIPTQKISDHRSTAHFNAMTKPLDTLFNGTTDNSFQAPPSNRIRKANHKVEPRHN
jgi:hypothetical protein